tara:strand:+ start:5754 stop:6482 length:729 start_codon:yes stop_codon:yes gene_type:complete
MIEIDIFPRNKDFNYFIENFPPQPANKFLPEWYKKNKIQTDKLESFGSDKQFPHAKNCPAIQEEVTNGIVIPAWTDIFFEIKDNVVEWEVAVAKVLESKFGWVGSHAVHQTTLMGLNDIYNWGILKLINPYYIKTPEGYGTAFRDVFYHHRKNIRLLPGMVETDIWHETNFPFEFITDTKDVEAKFVVEAGEPLVMLTPYKKEEQFTVNVNKYNEDFSYIQESKSINLHAQSNKWNKVKKDL